MQPLNIAHLYIVCYNLMDNGYNKGVYNMSVLDYPFDSAFILQKKKSIKKELLAKDKFIEKKVPVYF